MSLILRLIEQLDVLLHCECRLSVANGTELPNPHVRFRAAYGGRPDVAKNSPQGRF